MVRNCDLELEGILADPAIWFTLHLDRDTAEALGAALASSKDTSVVEGFSELLNDWLQQFSG